MDNIKNQQKISKKGCIKFSEDNISVKNANDPCLKISCSDIRYFENQVAGHQFMEGKETIGLLKCDNGTILKPIVKPDIGSREVYFYEQLNNNTNVEFCDLRDLCPKYYGTRTLEINGKNTEFIILHDITQDMIEPCVIDVKIGKITWDPLATPSKIAKEKQKYSKCKEDVGFCITGFQVYKISTNMMCKYGKEYGKNLDGNTAIEALKLFLNGDNGIVCQELLINLLMKLWKIRKWIKNQRMFHFYSTSLLLAYDCKMLKKFIHQNMVAPYVCPFIETNLARKTVNRASNVEHIDNQLLSSSPSFEVYMFSFIQNGIVCDSKRMMGWRERSINSQRIVRSSSFCNNYNEYIKSVKRKYALALKESVQVDTKKINQWFSVKMIDFAHTFPAKEPLPDTNYISGIDSFIRIFERFLNFSDQ